MRAVRVVQTATDSDLVNSVGLCGRSLNQALPRRSAVVVFGVDKYMAIGTGGEKSPAFSGAVPASCGVCPFTAMVSCRLCCSNACHPGRIEFPKSLSGGFGDATAAASGQRVAHGRRWERHEWHEWHGMPEAAAGWLRTVHRCLVTGGGKDAM